MSLSFYYFLNEYGEAGARERFEKLVVRIVKSLHPSAKPIRANPGDWGIDAYVGLLAEGQVRVWQAKFHLTAFGDSQKRQIRDAYTTARDKAAGEKYELLAWTLCIPIDFDPDEQKWWDDWATERQGEDGVQMELWNLAELEVLLAKPDAADVRQEYFPHLPPVHQPQAPAIVPPDDPDKLEELLFIRQLREAGLTELDSAKEQFYNAELVVRDLADKGLVTREEGFHGIQADYRSTWEDRFNHHCASSGDGDRLPGLHPDVMERVDQSHDAAPDQPFPLTKTHRKGALHQVVDRGQAGWTRNFRDIAKEHSGG